MSFIKDNETDNYITKKEEWFRIKKFIPPDAKIWSPFYCDGSQKEYFKEMGFDIIHEDRDFFSYEPEAYTLIIDNIPFSKKKEIFKRLKELDKPFMIIAPSLMIGYKYFVELFKNDIQLIVPEKRLCFIHLDNISYMDTKEKNYCPPFGSYIYCYKMDLQKDLNFI